MASLRFFSLLSAYSNKLDHEKPNADVVECSFDRGAGEGQICQVDVKGLIKGKCTKENDYGFQDGQPCFFLKLNRV